MMYKYILKCFMGHTYNREKSIVYLKFNLTGYPTFGGNSSRIVMSFDLAATS